MQKRTLKVAILAVLAIVLVLGMSTVALADQTWPDLPDTVTAKYGITDNQVAGISEGFTNGLWKPYQAVTRAQFTKMAVAAFNIPLADPAVASFVDVPKGSDYYPYIEGAKAAGIINGTSATTFGPKDNITRQQAIAIVARFVAQANGYDLATMYSAEEIDALLAHFGDAASISADLKDEVAFAFDMGLTNGDDYGNVKPLANMTRIQGAAFLIRAKALVPPEKWTPAKIELVSADKTEGLIGQIFSATFEVTDAAGHPAKNVLVDFDSLGGAEFYVGNVTQQAMMTNNYGQVTVDLISLEPGTQRVSASVAGVGTIYTTRYWLVIDEVYNVKGSAAQNNAGVEHEWAVRVLVFGPGPRSTSQSDWYNYVDAAFDPTNLHVLDGVDSHCAYDTYSETSMAKLGFTPRSLAGIDVEWAIYDKVDDPKTFPNEAQVSVGNIIAVDGVAITAAKTAVGKTDAAGYSSIKIVSEQTGKTFTEAVADYPENPYPEQMFVHSTFQDTQQHFFDWEDQPKDALQTKTWIGHTIGGPAGPISAAYDTANIGEELTLTIELKDTYGNPLAGKYVEWFMQGVGFFQTDDAGDSSNPDNAADNKDFDVTDANGKATLFVKSYDAGEQIVHAKVRDKGTGGSEGTYLTYTAEVQWFDADIATFDDITTTLKWIPTSTGVAAHFEQNNEALSANAVNGTHEFCMKVYGLKLEYVPSVDYQDGQTPAIDSDAAGASYDGILDAKDATYFGGIMMLPWVQQNQDTGSGALWESLWNMWDDKLIAWYGYDLRVPVYDVAGAFLYYDYTPQWDWIYHLPWDLPYDYNNDGIIDPPNGVIDAREIGDLELKIGGQWLVLSGEGAYTMYDHALTAGKEVFTGVPGIYLPLEGKTVTFAQATAADGVLSNLGSITAPTAAVQTDATGKACATVASQAKGLQSIKATVNWAGNPHNGPELLTAFAQKTWVSGTVGAATDVKIEVLIDGEKVADNGGFFKEATNPMWVWGDPILDGDDEIIGYEMILNSAHVEVHVKDAYGNDLADYEVVYLLENIDEYLQGSQYAVDTRIPFAYLTDIDWDDDFDGDPTYDSGLPDYDQNGPRPDSNEPSPSSDPYAYIVGPGFDPSLVPDVNPLTPYPEYDLDKHEAFFFNQWLGSDNGTHWDFLTLAKGTYMGQPGLPSWTSRVSFWELADYSDTPAQAWSWYTAEGDLTLFDNAREMFDGFDGVYVGDGATVADRPDTIYLATDGAKAWTLDGYVWDRNDVDGDSVTNEIVPNKLKGSHIDIQLAEGDILGADHYKSILRVMVYAPADGLTQEGSYIWSTQVHKVWQTPRPTTVVLEKPADYAITGLESETLTVTVLDQFGNGYPGQDIYMYNELLEGDIDANGTAVSTDGYTMDGATVMGTTDENGNLAVTYDATGTWGVHRITAYTQASNGGKASNKSVIQWIMDDTAAAYITATSATQKVVVLAGYADWNGLTLECYMNPGGFLFGTQGSQKYVDNADLFFSTNTMTWSAGQPFFVKAANSSNTDDKPNWIYTVAQ